MKSLIPKIFYRDNLEPYGINPANIILIWYSTNTTRQMLAALWDKPKVCCQPIVNSYHTIPLGTNKKASITPLQTVLVWCTVRLSCVINSNHYLSCCHSIHT